MALKYVSKQTGKNEMNLLEEAIIYSTLMHQGKVRKFKRIPYILHPLEVAQILSTMTDDQEVIAAGVLHDVVENTDGTLKEIGERFGTRVARLVNSASESFSPDEDLAASWKRRKEESLYALQTSQDIGTRMIWLADQLSNMRSLAGIYSEQGEKIWSFLDQTDPDEHLWYFRSVAEYVEMDLNRTGAYKELIKHINYIWPGSFDSKKTRYQKYREVSLDGCKRIGRGAKADVYRYNDELIVKVYNENNTYKDVERETAIARKTFVMGIPTAISFGIVAVGRRYGTMFELVDASTVSELIARDPGRVDDYGRIMAYVAREIHATIAKKEDGFPAAKDSMLEWVERGLADRDEKAAEKLKEMIESMEDDFHMVHGDFHTGNVFIQNGEPLIIDMDRVATGPSIVDLSNCFLFYVGYGELNPKTIEDYMGFSYETAKAFFQAFIRYYLQTDEENRVKTITDKAALLAYLRQIGQIRKRRKLSEREQEDIQYLMKKITDLLELVNDFYI